MDRRMTGVLLLVVALICTLTVPNAVGKKVVGSPVGEVIAGPPAVGSCVTAVTASGAGRGQTNAVTADRAVLDRALPVATIAACRGKVVGEVLSVSAANEPRISTLEEYDQAHPSCRAQVETYLGTTATTNLLGVAWSKSLYVDAVTVGPDAHDRAAGRTWSACVMSAVGQSYPAPSTLKSSWLTDTVPAAFGLCWADAVVQQGVPTACTTPHTTQQLAFGFVSSPSASGTSIVSAADPTSVAAGCEKLASAIMKTTDPTFGGSLAIKVVADKAGAPYVQCAVSATGGHLLTGSLIGLGSKPLPLS